jgi:hypothetical protein
MSCTTTGCIMAFCQQGAVRPGARCRDRSAAARSRQEKTVCGTSEKRSISPGGRPGMRS